MSRSTFTVLIVVNTHRFSEFITTFAVRRYIIGYAMKLLFSFLLAAMMGLGMTSSNPISKDGTYKGKRLWGKVQFVTSFPDFKVQVVDAFADLNVQIVEAFPDKPGKWQVVTSHPDFKVQVVDAFGDFKIKYVDAFPGVQ